ncbi:MAG: hypothetical protein ACLQC7_06255 [Thermoplasmata archaeon]
MPDRPRAEERVRQNEKLICDACQNVITRITTPADAEWATMHNLCSDCFRALWKQSIPPA